LTPHRQGAWISRKSSKELALYRSPATNSYPEDHDMKHQKLFAGLFAVLLPVLRKLLSRQKRRPEPGCQIIKIIYISVCAATHSITWDAW
jgi:hypothetical protein